MNSGDSETPLWGTYFPIWFCFLFFSFLETRKEGFIPFCDVFIGYWFLLKVMLKLNGFLKSTQFLHFSCSKVTFVFKVMGHFLICSMGDLFHLLAKMWNGRYVMHSTVNKVKIPEATTAVPVHFPIADFRELLFIHTHTHISIYCIHISMYGCMDVCLHVRFYLILTVCKEEIVISIFITGKELKMHRGVWVHQTSQSR